MKSQRKAGKAVILYVLGVVCLFGINLENNLVRVGRGLDEDPKKKDSKRPIMHTFYEPITAKGFDGASRDPPMMQVWKDEWKKAGFDIKVLTLDDAKKHPDFETMEIAVKKPFPTDTYNQLCFYRYLAMAADGGGWMSDIDTFPTHFPIEEAMTLPNNGKFTSFQGHVPGLLSASADEWTRVANIMVEDIPTSKQGHPSDMMILLDLYQQGTHDIDFKWRGDVSKPSLIYKEAHKVDCERMKQGRAIHMSHHSLAGVFKSGIYPIEATWPLEGKERAEGARAIMNEWREQCGGSSFPHVEKA